MRLVWVFFGFSCEVACLRLFEMVGFRDGLLVENIDRYSRAFIPCLVALSNTMPLFAKGKGALCWIQCLCKKTKRWELASLYKDNAFVWRRRKKRPCL